MSHTTQNEFVSNAMEAAIKIGAIFLLVHWCFDIIRPFISPLVWAAIIAIASKPLADWLEEKLGFGKKLAATGVVISLLAILITPTVMLSEAMLDNVSLLNEKIEEGSLDIPPPKESVQEWPLIGEKLYKVWGEAEANLESTLEKYNEPIKETVGVIVKQVANVGASIAVFIFSIIISGFLVATSEGSEKFVRQFGQRLAGDTGARFADLASVTVRNVTRGILGVAVIQALLAALGLYLMDFPAAPVLAFGVLILAIVNVSPGLILIPASIYAFNYAGTVEASIFLVWNIVVGALDNVLKPILMGKGTDIPMLVIFLGAIGGFIATGIVGLFVGAVILVLGYELFMAWLKSEALTTEGKTEINDA